MNKTIDLALDQSRLRLDDKIKGRILFISHEINVVMLQEERNLFDKLVSEFSMFRDGILNNLLPLQIPNVGNQDVWSEKKEV